MKKSATAKEACLRTAALFRRKPQTFRYFTINIPETQKDDGCPLGWMHYFMCIKGSPVSLSIASKLVIGVQDVVFYKRMTALAGIKDWTNDAAICADVLEQYAENYL